MCILWQEMVTVVGCCAMNKWLCAGRCLIQRTAPPPPPPPPWQPRLLSKIKTRVDDRRKSDECLLSEAAAAHVIHKRSWCHNCQLASISSQAITLRYWSDLRLPRPLYESKLIMHNNHQQMTFAHRWAPQRSLHPFSGWIRQWWCYGVDLLQV